MKPMFARYYMKILRYFSSKCKELIKIHCTLTDSETNIGYLLAIKITVIMIRKINDILSQL